MKKICLVTYMRKSEEFTDKLINIANLLNRDFRDFKCVLFSELDKEIPAEVEFLVEQINIKGTKYRRLIHLMDNDDSYYYISIDNDINGDLENIKKFVKKVINNDIDIAWGKIMVIPESNFISRLIVVDKFLSHYILRPLLWKSGYGISIPGQFFMFKSKEFKGKLLDVDTFLDDLALGLYVNQHYENLKTYHCKNILGYEEPNNSFPGLWEQRSRWAKGFSTIINNLDSYEKYLNLFHAFTYHGLWIINWLLIILLSLFGPLFSAVYVILISVIITRGKLRFFFDGIIYQFVFPIFHLRWIYCLIRGEKNDD